MTLIIGLICFVSSMQKPRKAKASGSIRQDFMTTALLTGCHFLLRLENDHVKD